jgi:methionyl-tRNA formyltransferase
LDTLPRWKAGQIKPKRQNESMATYAGLLRREDGRIDWADSAKQIARRCRAYDPWPGIFAVWRGKTVKLTRTRALNVEVPDQPPGSVVRLDSQIAVVTGQGLLIIEELQLAGRSRLPAEQFVRGQREFVGSALQ